MCVPGGQDLGSGGQEQTKGGEGGHVLRIVLRSSDLVIQTNGLSSRQCRGPQVQAGLGRYVEVSDSTVSKIIRPSCWPAAYE